MAVDMYEGLDPDFEKSLRQFETACAASGVELRAVFGLRDPVTQCKLWKQSRTGTEIYTKHCFLAAVKGLDFLIECLDKAPITDPPGKWATNAIGGEGWHQWGLAMDYAWIVNGQPEWSTALGGDKNGYATMARIAPLCGLTSGYSFGDAGHIQQSKFGSPHKAGMTMQQINDAMKAKFGNG